MHTAVLADALMLGGSQSGQRLPTAREAGETQVNRTEIREAPPRRVEVARGGAAEKAS